MTPHIYTSDDIADIMRDANDARDSTGYGRRESDSGGKWPAWVQTAVAVLAVIVSVVLAYGALDKRIALIEQALNEQRQKLDLIIYQQSGKR